MAFINFNVASVEEAAVLDGVDAGFNSQLRREVAVGVGSDFSLPLVRFGDDRGQLLGRQLRHVDGIGLGEHAARGADLDDVGAPLHLVAHGLAALVGAIADTFNRARQV